MEDKLNPFYFPTSIIFVDDDREFINNFTLLLDEKLSIQQYSSAKTALDVINNQESIFEKLKDFTDYTLLENADNKICLNIEALHQQIYNSERFAQISIALTDFAMPEMDGIEFLSKIKHSEIKRILLTGVADEKIAVEAFNEGLIDRFILKDADNLHTEINKAIKELQKSYFGLLGDQIHLAISDHTGDFLADPQFIKLFSKLCSVHNWVEYYLLEQPQGIMLLNSIGESSFLFVSSAEEMRSRYEIAIAEDAPVELLQLLKEGEHIPWFPTTDGFYTAESHIENWRECLFPVNSFNGTNNRFNCALVTPSPIHHIDLSKVSFYDNHIESVDDW